MITTTDTTLTGLAAQRRVLFVGGKGGVGKTSLASAIALARAGTGGRVLVVSTDPAHNLGHLWERPVGDSAVRLATNPFAGCVDGLEIDPQHTVDRHLAAVGDTMRRLLPERLRGAAERHLVLAREAPGTHESAVLERVAEVVESGLERYDLIVFDTAPTGHTVRLMALPEQLTTWTDTMLADRQSSARFGEAVGIGQSGQLREVLTARRRRFAGLRDLVGDEQRTSFVVVLTAERLPVAESLELHDQLCELGVEVGALVVNRRSPADAGAVLAQRRTQESAQLGTLRDLLPDVPLVEVPLLARELVGEHALAELAHTLAGSRAQN